MKYLVIISGVVGASLLYLLSSASANTDLFSHNYYVLLVMTGFLALGLAILLASQAWNLRTKLKNKVYGAKLTLRLVTIFSVIAIMPGILVYAVSVQFLSKSIESWFDVRVEKALEGGLNLGRSSLENGLAELGKKGHLVAMILAEQDVGRHSNTLARLIKEGGAQEAAVFGAKGQLLGYANAGGAKPTELPTAAMLGQAWANDGYSMVEVLPDDQLALRVLIPVKSARWKEERRTLQFLQPVPRQIAADAETVQAVYRDYQELSLSRLGLKRLYGVTLTLSLLIVLLSVSSVAFYLSEQLSAPLAALAEGTLAVAKGDFSGNYPVQSRDELGALTGLFNQMTAYLADAKRTGEQQQLQVENAKVYLESVLAHLSSGVLVVDEQHRLRSSNPSANQILGVPLQEMAGKTLREIAAEHALLRSFIEAVMQGFGEDSPHEWQRQMERMSKGGDQMLLLRGTQLSTNGRQRLRGGVRRHHASVAGGTSGCVGRSGATPGARNQESAYADPAVGGASAAQIAFQTGRAGCATAAARHPDHRQPGRGDEEHGDRICQLCARAGDTPVAAGHAPAVGRSDGLVRSKQQPDHVAAQCAADMAERRCDAPAPGDPQFVAERPRCIAANEDIRKLFLRTENTADGALKLTGARQRQRHS